MQGLYISALTSRQTERKTDSLFCVKVCPAGWDGTASPVASHFAYLKNGYGGWVGNGLFTSETSETLQTSLRKKLSLSLLKKALYK